MCELLVKAADHIHPDPQTDRVGAYKRGMVVRVEDDGFDWGGKEGPPSFVIIRITGELKADYAPLTEIETYDDSGVDTGTLYRRRSFYIDIDNLPPGIRTNIETMRLVDIPPGIITSRLKRRRDGAIFKKGRQPRVLKNETHGLYPQRGHHRRHV